MEKEEGEMRMKGDREGRGKMTGSFVGRRADDGVSRTEAELGSQQPGGWLGRPEWVGTLARLPTHGLTRDPLSLAPQVSPPRDTRKHPSNRSWATISWSVQSLYLWMSDLFEHLCDIILIIHDFLLSTIFNLVPLGC